MKAKEIIKSFNPNFSTNHTIYSCVQVKNKNKRSKIRKKIVKKVGDNDE